MIDPNLMAFEICRGITEYFAYQILSRGLSAVVDTSSIPQINNKHIYPMEFSSPQLDEQDKIARFLKHRTHLIDRFIRNKGRLIELLQEQKQAVINDCVTGKMEVRRIVDENGNSSFRLQPSSCKMRDSGIDWLGEIPEHWEVKPLGTVTDYISYGFTNPMPITDDGPYMLTATDIGDGKIQYQTARHTSQDAFDRLLTQKSCPRANDILITKDGTLGRIAIADGQRVCISQSVALLRTNIQATLHEFVAEALQADGYQQMMVFDAGGTTIKHIYITRLVKMRMAFPPKAEQLSITREVQQLKKVFANTTANIERQIDLIQEYRTRLIADVVTGKVDVRGISVEDVAED